MAGSFVSQDSDLQASLEARIEGLKLLAQHVNEPIVIFNPQLELIYANPSADKLSKLCPLIPSQLTLPSESSVAVEQTPCEPCPAKHLFQMNLQELDASTDSLLSSNFPDSCPVPRAVPLYSKEGTIHVAVLMGARSREIQMLDSPHNQPCSFHDTPASAGELEAWKGIIGESEPIQQLVEMIQLVAASEATVLIQGESGTGKELVAKTIHALSRRRKQPFVVVECSALPETLLESELFGHVRGAFTGAVVDRKGLFEEAEGGTIFLDEIADTTPAFQARLLRVLQEGEIKPVGSNRSIKVDVRVISAGNRSLEELVKESLFRADLYYRLAVLPLRVPPLRERQEDIPLLVKHFLDISTRRHGRPPLTVHPEVLRALSQHEWPGNVRELENCIERAVVTCRHTMIQVADFLGNRNGHRQNTDLNSVSKAARQIAERDRILQVLSETQGDKTRAARLLKISRSNLYNKLRDYHIS